MESILNVNTSKLVLLILDIEINKYLRYFIVNNETV